MQVLEIDKWHEVSAFQWLTGWPQENLLDPLHGPSLTVSPLSCQCTSAWSHGAAALPDPVPACWSIVLFLPIICGQYMVIYMLCIGNLCAELARMAHFAQQCSRAWWTVLGWQPKESK